SPSTPLFRSDQIHLAGIVFFVRQWPITHLNSKATLPEARGQCEFYALGFSLHIGPTCIHAPKVIGGRRQVVLLRANPRELKAVASDFVIGLFVQAWRGHPWLQFQLVR